MKGNNMARLGINVRIDVNKIDKEKLYKGEKGTYLDLTTWVDTENKDQYDNNGFISQSTTKEEREAGVQTPILGNVNIFYKDYSGEAPAPAEAPKQEALEEDVPF